MVLRIVETAGLSDVGRQRSSNEDAYLADAPFFAVADGMGGARAGEVASGIAAEAFGQDPAAEASPERRLAAIARAANSRIHELAQRDESRRGMGTTLTAAMLADGELSIAHVGDSRAYRLRDGQLEQLTHDHSLVAELERSGQITAEEAVTHPQRSIITRALGPEPEVEVDTYTHRLRAGDVYLLCSDGLTGMVSDQELAAILRQAPTLQAAADALIQAANQSGGKDNITVVLFRVGEAEGEGEGGGEPTPPADETIAGQVSADEVQAAAAATPPAAAEPAAGVPPPARARAPRAPEPPRAEPARAKPARRGPRRALGALAALVLVAAIAAGLYFGSRQVYFVGTDDAGLVTLYRGLPYDLPAGIEPYSAQYESSVPARSLTRRRRERVLNHEWRGKTDAQDLVRQLERGSLEGQR